LPVLESSPLGLESSPLVLESSPLELESSPLELESSPLELESSRLELESSRPGLESSPPVLESSPTGLESSPPNCPRPVNTNFGVRQPQVPPVVPLLLPTAYRTADCFDAKVDFCGQEWLLVVQTATEQAEI
jgi:hypothetical protein